MTLDTGQILSAGDNIPTPGLPGSLMKMITTALLCEEGILPVDQAIECRGSVAIGRVTWTCPIPHGRVSLVQALGHSCNVYFAQAAENINPQLFLDYARLFGLADRVAEYPSGPFPQLPSQKAAPYVLGLSPDLQPNPLQILRMTGLIAGKGIIKPLYHTKKILSPDIQVQLSDYTWSVLAQGMQLACRQGTARQLDPQNQLHLAVATRVSLSIMDYRLFSS
jgi:cell division protein FtsI/penicillin-binding protein 2